MAGPEYGCGVGTRGGVEGSAARGKLCCGIAAGEMELAGAPKESKPPPSKGISIGTLFELPPVGGATFPPEGAIPISCVTSRQLAGAGFLIQSGNEETAGGTLN
ncbi:MAG TPA: hypothetical protein VIM48_11245 [Chthoniobacterales bacterium]